MRATRIDNEYLYFLIYGSGYIDVPWSHLWGSNEYFNDHWNLFVRPTPRNADVGLVDMSNESAPNIQIVYTNSYAYNQSNQLVYTQDSGAEDLRTADRLTLDHKNVGPDASYHLALQGVEYVDAPVENLDTHLRIITKDGFTTDGTLASVTMHVGHQEMVFTGAARDSTIFMGAGYDTIEFVDHLDVPGEQFWSVIRRPDGELDVYSLFSGYRVQLGGGYKGWTAAPSALMNYGEIEQITLRNYEDNDDDVYLPGVDLPSGGDRGTASNIDLRSDNQLHSDSFNLAYFNFIRYTSDNVWVGEATIHDGTDYSTPSDRRVATDKNIYLNSGYDYDAPVLAGLLSVIGQSRNGTHDLIVAEQATAIDGKFRLYTFNVASELYNEFNEVFLGSGSDDASDKSSIGGSDWSDRVALYGFGGEDVLKGGAGRDYIFGGQSVYNQLIAGETGNQVTGGTGADYFGVGNTNSFGAVTGANSTIGTQASTGAFHQGFATDVIMDWHAGQDTVVVLSNGVAVVGGLRDGTGVVSLSSANTIDFRDYAAVATSDQDFDGARGGDNWDQTQSLEYIYNNQATRDANSIANEADRTVVNDGLIVARGLDGNDTIYGSAGADYLYGNGGRNLISLSEGGADRVYIDTFDSAQARHYVSSFDTADDQVFVNKRVIDAFGGNTSRALSAVDVGGTYTQAVQYNPSINFLHDTFYSPSIIDTNANHDSEDGSAPSVLSGSDGTTFGIGVGMVAAGVALLFVPFAAGAGYALIASGTALGAGSALVNTQEHRNATYDGNVGNYLNVITGNTLQTAGNTLVATDVNTSDSNVRFLDFFGGSNANDGFIPVVEFTAHAGQGIYGYFALHSNTETFVFLVASRDNLVENGEAIKIAEINGLLYADDFKVYDGQADIYNVRTEDPVVLREPTVTSVADTSADEGLTDDLIDNVQGAVSIVVNMSGAIPANSYLKVYDKTTLIYDGSQGTPVNASVSATLTGTTYTVVDGRSLGTVATKTDTNALTGNNDFVLSETVVNYSIEFVDGTTGIPTRDASGAITITGGNATIDGGSGSDTLNVTGTSDYLNGADDSQLVRIETIYVSASDTDGNGVINSSDDTVFVDLSSQSDGFTIYGTGLADSIIGSSGNDTVFGLGGQDTIALGAGGADQIAFTYSDASLGSDTNYDVITGVSSNDQIYVAPSGVADTDNDGAVDDPVSGFDDRDGDAARLMYETATLGAEMAVASATELLVVSDSSVSSAGDVTAAIATALDSAFNLAGLDGDAPSSSTGGGSDSSVLYAVRSDTGSYWVGRYEDIGNNDTLDGNTEIEIFANVSADNILDSFWLPTELAPQALTINLPSTVDTGAGELYTQSTTFSVGGLQSGNQVYYSLNGGSNWQTAAVNQTVISLNMNQSNDIRVRQVDGNNYSPETTAGANSVTPVTVIWDDNSPDTAIGLLAFTSLGSYQQSTYNGKPYYIDVEFDTTPYEAFGGPAARIYFDFDDKADIDASRWNYVNVVKSVQVHDLSNTLSDYDGGLNDYGAAYIAVDEVGRVTINTNDIDGERTATSGIEPDFRLRVEFDIPLVGGGYQNFIFDGYIDNGANIA